MHQDRADKTDPPFEYTWITGQVAIGTNACCQTHFEERLKKDGVTVDISLEGERMDRPEGVDLYLWIPTADHAAPGRDETLMGLAALREALAAGRKVYIHCRNGHGRAPTFFAAHLIRETGMSAEAAIALIREKRPSAHLEDVQKAFLETL